MSRLTNELKIAYLTLKTVITAVFCILLGAILLVLPGCQGFTYDSMQNTYRKVTPCVDVMYTRYSPPRIDWYQGTLVHGNTGSLGTAGMVYNLDYMGPFDFHSTQYLEERCNVDEKYTGVYLISFPSDNLVFGYGSGSRVLSKDNVVNNKQIPRQTMSRSAVEEYDPQED